MSFDVILSVSALKEGFIEVCKRPKFVPRNKTVKELRNEKQIAVGPHFEEMLEEKVHIDGGSGRMIPLYS